MTEQENTRGASLRRSGKTEEGGDGRKWIVTIGIDEYRQMRPLHNAVGDATGIHALFTERLGFEAPLPPLLNGEATRPAIGRLLEDRLPELVGEDDSLVLFFAGHGKSRGQKGRERGYLAPVEAGRDSWADYIRIHELLNVLDDLPARHIVAILDACHSGFALGRAMVSTRSDELPRYVQELQRKKSRRVLTSAMAEQEALDGGPVDGHSLFTGVLIHGLRAGLADTDGNGVITTSELGEYVRTCVATYSNSSQTPDYGRFAPYHDERGELVFTSGAPRPPAPAPPRPAAAPEPEREQQTKREAAEPAENLWSLFGKAARRELEGRLESEPPPAAPEPPPVTPSDPQQGLNLSGWWYDNSGGRFWIQQSGHVIQVQGLDGFGNVLMQGQGILQGQAIQYEAQNVAGQVARGAFTVSPDGRLIQGNISWWQFNMPAGTFYIQWFRQ